MKVKTHKDCKYKCVNVKGGSGESKRLTQDLSHGIGTHLATPLVHIVEALTQEYASQSPSLPRDVVSTSPAHSCQQRSTPSRRVADLSESH